MPPPSNRYTNVRSLGATPAPQPIFNRRQAPYVSSANHEGQRGVMPLTANEREARRQQRSRMAALGGRPVTLRNAADGFVIDPISGRNTVQSGTSSFFSAQLSTDFLELPQSLREKREIYRHFYNADPLVG